MARAGEELPSTAQLFLEHLTAGADDRHPGFTLGGSTVTGLTSGDQERHEEEPKDERH